MGSNQLNSGVFYFFPDLPELFSPLSYSFQKKKREIISFLLQNVSKISVNLLCHFAPTNENTVWLKSWQLSFPHGKSNVLHLCYPSLSLVQIKIL